jgi:hypothetical protein
MLRNEFPKESKRLPRWDKFDRVFLGALVIAAILATAAFGYIVARFVR